MPVKASVGDGTGDEPRAIVDSDEKSRKYLYPRSPAYEFPKDDKLKPSASAPVLKPVRPVTDQGPRKQRPNNATFSKAERFDKLKNPKKSKLLMPTPGPADYNEDRGKDITTKWSNFTLSYKHDTTTGQDINPLAPNAYNLNHSNKEFHKTWTFGKDQKHSLKNLGGEGSNPGPGKYEIYQPRPNTSSRKGTMGFGKRDDLYKTSLSCNPEKDYQVNQHTIEYKQTKVAEQYEGRNAVRPSTGATTKITSEATTSGPGTENIGFNGTKINPPQWSFGSSIRRPLTGVQTTDIAPGHYYNASKNEKAFPPSHSLNRLPLAKRRPLNENLETPGPGTYNFRVDPNKVEEDQNLGKVPLGLFGGPSFSMRGKFKPPGYNEAIRVPGPGNYEFDHTYGLGYSLGKSHKFGVRKRFKGIEKTFQPGPGAYEIKRDLEWNTGIAFPRSKRPPPNNGADPEIAQIQHYDLKSTVPQLQCYEMRRMMASQVNALKL